MACNKLASTEVAIIINIFRIYPAIIDITRHWLYGGLGFPNDPQALR